MFAIAFDLIVQQTETSHPRSVSQAYADIGAFKVEHWSDFTDFMKS